MRDKTVEWVDIDIFQDDEIEEENETQEDSYLDKENEDMSMRMDMSLIKKMVQTPMGPVLMDDSFHPLRGLPISVCHVNFAITEQIIEDLDKVDGIEAFKQLGRYRLLFIFGKLFDTDEIKDDIQKTLGVVSHIVESVSIDEFPESVKEIIYEIDSNIEEDNWVVYIFPNGKYLLDTFATEEETLDRYKEFQELHLMSEGLLISSVEPTE